MRELFLLDSDDGVVVDGSAMDTPIVPEGNVVVADEGVALRDGGRLLITSPEPWADSGVFTVEATITVERLGARQVVIEGQNPPIRIAVREDGRVEAGVHTGQGWQLAVSDTKVASGRDTEVRFLRDEQGDLVLELDGIAAAPTSTRGSMKATGQSSLSIGSAPDGSAGFTGMVGSLRVLDTAVTAADERARSRSDEELSARLSERWATDVLVLRASGKVDERLQQVKAYMRALGITNLSELGTLTVTKPTRLRRGTVLVGRRRAGGRITDVVTDLQAAAQPTHVSVKEILDRHLPSRTTTENAQPVRGNFAPARRGDGEITDQLPARDITRLLRESPPDQWPTFTSGDRLIRAAAESIPVDEAVIIAKRLDLTNKTLTIDPDVAQLVIIAEEVDARKGAQITWRRPPLPPPPDLGANPALNGRSFKKDQIVLQPGTNHGLDGGKGLAGKDGRTGWPGHNAPSVEIWTKTFNGLPDVDLEGQDGGRGGRGQQGGNGGQGAKGREAKCAGHLVVLRAPGNGGDGGRGGNGGDGGRGGRGGDAGDFTIGVVESLDHLVDTATMRLQGGDGGEGGDGGRGGHGGVGGDLGRPRCASNTKKGREQIGRNGREGADGASGIRGRTGPDGLDSKLTLSRITEAEWDEQLSKPWISQVVPPEVFPGDTVTITGPNLVGTDKVNLSGGGNSRSLSAVQRSDGALKVKLPGNLEGGRWQVRVHRSGQKPSNAGRLTVRPRLASVSRAPLPGETTTLNGSGFKEGALVDYGGLAYPAEAVTPNSLEFTVPGNVEVAQSIGEKKVRLTVINPEGSRSNHLVVTQQGVLASGFIIGTHDYGFENNSSLGAPSWRVFERTYGRVEIGTEIVFGPLFARPGFVFAWFGLYERYLQGGGDVGATGFCSGMASTALDRYWTGAQDTHSITDPDERLRETITAAQGRLLSREVLISMHEQGRRGDANIETVVRAIENSFADGGSRQSAPLLFFIPSGAVWSADYIDRVRNAHCVVPTRIRYPIGYDGTDLADLDIDVWDNNHPNNRDCRVEIRRCDGRLCFQYVAKDEIHDDLNTQKGFTLGFMSLGDYLLRDVDLPFAGPAGLTSFMVDFLLSPATLQVRDEEGRQAGVVDGQIRADIPGSHPAYLLPNVLMLPAGVGLTRTITGTDQGTYRYASLTADGSVVGLEDVAIEPGETDQLEVNADTTRVRFTPSVTSPRDSSRTTPKRLTLHVSRQVGEQARGIQLKGLTADNDVDITLSPDLSALRISAQTANIKVVPTVSTFSFDTEADDAMDVDEVNIAAGQELVVTVSDWSHLDPANVRIFAV